jgi:hypothetical protein
MLRLLNFLRIIRLAKVLEESKKLRDLNLRKKKKEKQNYFFRKSLFKVKREQRPVKNFLDDLKNTKRLSANIEQKHPKYIEESGRLFLKENTGVDNGSRTNTEQELNGNDYKDVSEKFKLQLKSTRHQFVNPINTDLSKFLNKRKITVDELLKTSKDSMEKSSTANGGIEVSPSEDVQIINNNITTNRSVRLNLLNERASRLDKVRKMPINLTHFKSINEVNESADNLSVNDVDNPHTRNRAILLANRAMCIKRKRLESGNMTGSIELLIQDTNTRSFSNITIKKKNGDLNDPASHISLMRSMSKMRSVNDVVKTSDVISKLLIRLSKQPDEIKSDNLGNKLVEKIIQKVVIVVMFLLISLPIIDADYITSFIYPPEYLPAVSDYCLNGLDTSFAMALEDPVYIDQINFFLQFCTNTTDATDSIPFFTNIDFSNYSLYTNLTNLYGKSEYAETLPLAVYNYTSFNVTPYFHRNGRDYKFGIISFDNLTYISYEENTYLSGRLTSELNLIKNVFVSILLIISAQVFSYDITSLVIQPVKRIMARLVFYLSSFDMVEKLSLEKMHLDSTTIILLNEKKNSLKSKKNKQKKNRTMETYLIDKAMKKLIGLISLSIGKPILIIASSDNDHLDLDTRQPGYTFKATMLKLKLTGIDSLVETYQERAMSIINQVYQIFHCTGLNFFGDIYGKENMILWRENKKQADVGVRLYINRVGGVMMSEKEIENLESNIDDQQYVDFSLDYILSAALLCANQFLQKLQRYYKRIFQFLERNNIGIILYLDYGEFIGGYIGGKYKMDEIYLSPKITKANKLLETLPKDKSAMFIFEDFYELLDPAIQKYLYPYILVKSDSIYCTLYRQYLFVKSARSSVYNSPITEEEAIFDVKIVSQDILKERKEVESDYVSSDRDMGTFVLDDGNFKLSIGKRVNFTIISALTMLFKNICLSQLNECYEIIKYIKRIKLNKVNDPVLQRHVVNLQKILTGAIIPKKFTIEI